MLFSFFFLQYLSNTVCEIYSNSLNKDKETTKYKNTIFVDDLDTVANTDDIVITNIFAQILLDFPCIISSLTYMISETKNAF